ncbi:hypothetical protein, partial [Streptomyces heilongjiangensis]
MPKDPVTSGNAEAGVFVFVQACVARSGCMSGVVDALEVVVAPRRFLFLRRPERRRQMTLVRGGVSRYSSECTTEYEVMCTTAQAT